jgi:hypothetical protein
MHLMWTYGTTSPCYALWYGEWSADNLFKVKSGTLSPRRQHRHLASTVVVQFRPAEVSNLSEWHVEIIPRNLLTAYLRARLNGHIYQTDLASIDTQRYGPLVLIERQPMRHGELDEPVADSFTSHATA